MLRRRRSTDTGAAAPRNAVIESELKRLGLQFPLWLFDPTSKVHPRKLDSIPASSRPARITGWSGYYWEYGLNVEKVDPEKITQTPPGKLRAIEDVLSRIRFDDALDEDDYEAILDDGGILSLVDLMRNSVSTSQVKSIKRKWDDAVLWDKPKRFDAISNASIQGWYSWDGLAVQVHDIDHLARVSEVSKNNVRDVPVRAQFQFTDEEGGVARGIVYNGRVQVERGIIPTATREYNDQFLRGTDREDELGTIGRPN